MPWTPIDYTAWEAGDFIDSDLFVSQVLDNLQFLFDSLGQSMPVGAVVATGRVTAPTGFLFCHGQLVSRTEYPELWTAIGGIYGAGDGSSTFGLPDMRGRFPLGKAVSGTGSTLGSTGGALDHTHTGPNHAHSGPSHAHSNPNTSTGGHHAHGVGNHNHVSQASGTPSLTYVAHDPMGGPTIEIPHPAHNHTFSPPYGGPGGTYGDGDHWHPVGSTNPGGTNNTGNAGTGATGGGNPPFQVVNFMIKVGTPVETLPIC